MSSKGADVTGSRLQGEKPGGRVWEVFLDNRAAIPSSQGTASNCVTAPSCSWAGVHRP